jgi:hypothetical protein
MEAIRKKKIAVATLYLLLICLSIGLTVFFFMGSEPRAQFDSGVKPPLGEGLPFKTYEMNVQHGMTIKEATGTIIRIPADALEDKNGKKVKGKVLVKFREFQNADEVFLSGIPMQFGADRTDYFSSAGMMELQAFQDGKPLELTRNVEVELAAPFYPDEKYKLYRLSEDAKWDKGKSFKRKRDSRSIRNVGTGTKSEVPNQMPKVTASQEDEPKSRKKDLTGFTFELVGKEEKMPHLKAWKGVTWTLVEPDETLEPESALRIDWDMVEINPVEGKDDCFQLNFTKSFNTYDGQLVERTCSMVARPNLNGQQVAEKVTQFNKDLAVYGEELRKDRLEEERSMVEASVRSTFSISQFGVYNIDKLKDLESLVSYSVGFDFQDELDKEHNKLTLFVVMKDERSVFTFSEENWNDVSIAPGECYLVAILPGKQVAYVSPEKFRAKVKNLRTRNADEKPLFFETQRISFDAFRKQLLPKDSASRFS